jgi:hypothetical protein
MIVPLLLLLAQSPAAQPAVGDTIWISRVVEVPEGARVRPPDWQPTGEVELLGRPELTVQGDSAILRFPLVAWTAGSHSVRLPGVVLLRADGSTDSLPSSSASFTVRSVLPDRPVEELAIQPPASVVNRRAVSFLPPLVAAALMLALVLPLHWWWRKRGDALPPEPVPSAPAVPVADWAGAGEVRSVLSLASGRLRLAMQQADPAAHTGLESADAIAVLRDRKPILPVNDVERLLKQLDAARFAPLAAADAEALYTEAEALRARLSAEPVA